MFKYIPKLIYLPALFILFLISVNHVNAGTITKPVNNLGLVGYWSFNDGISSTTTDFSGNGRHGTLQDNTSWTTGKRGRALDFDGSGDYVSLGGSTAIQPGTGDFSVSFWYKGGSGNFIGATPHNVFPTKGWHIDNDNYDFRGGSWKFMYGDFTLPSDNEWHHFTFTLERKSSPTDNVVKIYIDGQTISITGQSGDLSENNSITSATYIGAADSVFSPQSRQGPMDEVRIYNRLLSASEAQRLYEVGLVKINTSPINKLTENLTGYWTFDGSTISGTKVTDVSGNGRTGTLKNGVVPTIGQLGQALSFNSTQSQYVKITTNNTIRPQTDHWAVSFWYKGAPNSKQIYIGGGTSVLDNMINITPTYADFNNGSGRSNTYTSAFPDDGDWHHAVVVLNRNPNPDEVEVYLDGAVWPGTKSGTMTDDASVTPADINIGRPSWTGGATYNQGDIDEVRIYKGWVPSLQDVKQLYNMGASKFNKTPLSKGTLANGLTGHWTFDGPDISGTTISDISGNGRDGTHKTTPTIAIGRLGQAVDYTGGSGNYTMMQALSNFITASEGTVSVWARPTAVAISVSNVQDGRTIVGASRGNTVNDWNIGISQANTGGQDKIWAWNYSTTPSLDSVGVDYTVGEWIHIVWVHSGGTLYAYKNGALAGQTASADTTFTGANLKIGLGTGSNPFSTLFRGDIDDTRIWNRALTADEIQQLYNMGR